MSRIFGAFTRRPSYLVRTYLCIFVSNDGSAPRRARPALNSILSIIFAHENMPADSASHHTAMDCFDLTALRRASVLVLDLWNFAKRYAEVLADSFNKGVNKVKDTPPSFAFAAGGSFITLTKKILYSSDLRVETTSHHIASYRPPVGLVAEACSHPAKASMQERR